MERPEPDARESMPKRIAVAISGGGHRAALFGLGVLLYLVDAGENKNVVSIASVSGGSLTNGFAAQSVAYSAPETDRSRFDQTMKPLVHCIAQQGTVLPPDPLTAAYLGVLALVIAGTFVGVWFLPWPIWGRVISFFVALAILGLLANLRGWIAARAFASRLFSPSGFPTRLDSVNAGLDHVICAADLHAGENVYFARDFVASYRFGWGVPGDLPLHLAVQASAALPGAFPPRWLPTARHKFDEPRPEARGASRLCLVDGGVYDNMADQWVLGMANRRKRFPSHADHLRDVDELIVVNGSGGLDWGPVWRVRIPLLGEFLALLHDKTVLYDNGNSVRRELLVVTYERSYLVGAGLRGALVHIPQSPLRVATAYRSSTDPEVAARAAEVLALLGPTADRWDALAKNANRMRTSLTKLGTKASADLLEHGYVLAMCNLHVILGYELRSLPDRARLEALAS
jgi:predicted acylesterase/phospholipase RssA